jgi:hypothetical protein
MGEHNNYGRSGKKVPAEVVKCHTCKNVYAAELNIVDEHDYRTTLKDLLTRRFPRRHPAKQPPPAIVVAPTGWGKTEAIIKLGLAEKMLVLSTTKDAQDELDSRGEAKGIKSRMSFHGRHPVDENSPASPGGCQQFIPAAAAGAQEHAPSQAVCPVCLSGHAYQMLQYREAHDDEAMTKAWDALDACTGHHLSLSEIKRMACQYHPQHEKALKASFVTAQVSAFTTSLLEYKDDTMKQDRIVAVDETPEPFKTVCISLDTFRDLCEMLAATPAMDKIVDHLRGVQLALASVATTTINVPAAITDHCKAIFDLLLPSEQTDLYNIAAMYTATWERPVIDFNDPDKSDIPLRLLQTLIWCAQEGWLRIHRQELVCTVPTLLTTMAAHGKAHVIYYSATPNQNLMAITPPERVYELSVPDLTPIELLPNAPFFKGNRRRRAIIIKRQAKQAKALFDARNKNGNAYILTHKDLAKYLCKMYPALKDRFLWWGRHDKALDAYNGCHLIICGLPIPPESDLADMYSAHALILRHQGIEWPEWSELEWTSGITVQIGTKQRTSTMRVPKHLGARTWYLRYLSQHVIQAVGRPRGADGHSGSVTLAIPFIPLPAEYKNITIAHQRPAELGMTRHDYATIRHDDSVARCLAAYADLGGQPTHRAVNAWLQARRLRKVRHSIWRVVRALTPDERRHELAKIKRRCPRWQSLGRLTPTLAVVLSGHRLQTVTDVTPGTAIDIPVKPTAVSIRSKRAPPPDKQAA